MKYFIDTDIGDDIDDALAIGYAIAKGLDIVGITTVYRETATRAATAKKLAVFSDNGIPVYGGYSAPMSKNVKIFGRTNYGTADGISREEPEKAIEFMANCAERYGQELCIVAIGAQTNLAAAWLKYPDKMKKTGLVVIMGGSFAYQRNEWNISEDPTAARIVGESEMNLFYVPLDVTEKTGIGKENYDIMLNRYGSNVAGCVSDMVREWKSRSLYSYIPILHDPAAIICAIDKDLCKTQQISFCVIDQGAACGLTLNASAMDLTILPDFEKKKITVVTEIDTEGIIAEFMQTLYGKE